MLYTKCQMMKELLSKTFKQCLKLIWSNWQNKDKLNVTIYFQFSCIPLGQNKTTCNVACCYGLCRKHHNSWTTTQGPFTVFQSHFVLELFKFVWNVNETTSDIMFSPFREQNNMHAVNRTCKQFCACGSHACLSH